MAETTTTSSSSAQAETVAAEVRRILAEHARLATDVADVADDDDLYAAGMTSHASVTVMLACEDAYDLEFPQAMLKKSTFATVGSIVEALTGLGAGA